MALVGYLTMVITITSLAYPIAPESAIPPFSGTSHLFSGFPQWSSRASRTFGSTPR